MVLCKAIVDISVKRTRELDRLWKDAENLDEYLDISDRKHVFMPSLLPLRLGLRHYSFIPVTELNYKAVFSWMLLNIKGLCFPFYVFFFFFFENRLLKKWWNKKHFCPTMVARPLQNFFKVLSVDFSICWWHISKFFKNHESKNLSLSVIIRCSQNLQEEMRDYKKSNIP